MPSILELFQSKTLLSGQTAEQQYDIQNLKKRPIRTNSGVIDVLAAPVNLLRKTLSIRTRETRLEEEATGIRQIRSFASPVLYGTAILKLKLKQSSSVVTMKNGANTTLDVTDGKLSNVVNKIADKAKEVGNNVLSKLGIQLPEAQLPTRVAGKIKTEALLTGLPISPDKLKQIQQASQGNGAGRILASIGQGATGEQIKNQVLGAGINAAKKAATKFLFGAAERVKDTLQSAQGSGTVSIRQADTSFNSKRKYSSIVKIRSKQDGDIDDFGNYTSLNNLQGYLSKPMGGAGLLGALASLTQPEGLFIMNKTVNDSRYYANPQSTISFPEYPEFSLDSITQNIPNKRDVKKVYSKSDVISNFVIDSENKPKFKTKKDLINVSKPWYSETGEPSAFPDGTTIDDYDFIPLRFYSLNKQTGVSFKATVSGLNETFSPSWEPNRFLGNPYNFYTYDSIERSVSFSFKVYSLNNTEHVSNWQKLNFLAGLTYPANYISSVYTIPPFIKFTLGDMYKNKECFVESLSYEIDDTTPWEIGLTAIKKGNRISEVNNSGVTKYYRLPTIVNVNLTLKFIETQSMVAGKRLYGYGSPNINNVESQYNLLPDGTSVKTTPESQATRNFVEDFKKL